MLFFLKLLPFLSLDKTLKTSFFGRNTVCYGYKNYTPIMLQIVA